MSQDGGRNAVTVPPRFAGLISSAQRALIRSVSWKPRVRRLERLALLLSVPSSTA
jgi:hypothetical protein